MRPDRAMTDRPTRPLLHLHPSSIQPVAPGEFGLLFTDGAKFGRAEQLHLALQGLWKFEEAHGRPPQPNSDADAEEASE